MALDANLESDQPVEPEPIIDPVTGEEQPADPYAAALLRERLGEIRRGRGERVKAIEAELERIGYEAVETVERAVAPKGNRIRATKE